MSRLAVDTMPSPAPSTGRSHRSLVSVPTDSACTMTCAARAHYSQSLPLEEDVHRARRSRRHDPTTMRNPSRQCRFGRPEVHAENAGDQRGDDEDRAPRRQLRIDRSSGSTRRQLHVAQPGEVSRCDSISSLMPSRWSCTSRSARSAGRRWPGPCGVSAPSDFAERHHLAPEVAERAGRSGRASRASRARLVVGGTRLRPRRSRSSTSVMSKYRSVITSRNAHSTKPSSVVPFAQSLLKRRGPRRSGTARGRRRWPSIPCRTEQSQPAPNTRSISRSASSSLTSVQSWTARGTRRRTPDSFGRCRLRRSRRSSTRNGSSTSARRAG